MMEVQLLFSPHTWWVFQYVSFGGLTALEKMVLLLERQDNKCPE